MKIYIAGAYTSDPENNVNKAMEVADEVFERGDIPFLPHLFHFWNLKIAHRYEDWMKMGSVFLKDCDQLIRIPGESSGADREVEMAKELGIPVIIWGQNNKVYEVRKFSPEFEKGEKSMARGVLRRIEKGLGVGHIELLCKSVIGEL